MKRIFDFTVIAKQSWLRVAMLKLHCDEMLPEIRGGQFVQVRVDGCQKAYLRICAALSLFMTLIINIIR